MSKDVDTHELFCRLVRNALDFLSHSIEELEKFPKYSVIHFNAAVELFLKARLMHEHWTLVISKSKEPDWDNIISGGFQSVSLDEAASRLKKIVRSGLTDQELSAFRSVTKHRNKFVHFFHEADSEVRNREMLQRIVSQQLYAWYLLHKLITRRWDKVFRKWSQQIAEIDKKLREHHEFLRVIFNDLKKEIEKRVAAGSQFEQCHSCGFKSLEYSDQSVNEPHEAACLVCDLVDRYLLIECPNCNAIVRFENEGYGNCARCGKRFDPDELTELLSNKDQMYLAFKDGDNSWDLGNCSDCDGYHTVVRLEDSYLCTSCLGTFESLANCEWCNEPNTGDMEESYFMGCNFCDGHAGWDQESD